MSKLTTGVAVVFMLTSLTLSMISSEDRQVTILDDVDQPDIVEELPPIEEPPEEAGSAGAIDPFAIQPPADETATDKDSGTGIGEK